MATEIINERLLYPSYEIIGGKKFMSPAANLTHSGIIGRLYVVLFNHLKFLDTPHLEEFLLHRELRNAFFADMSICALYPHS